VGNAPALSKWRWATRRVVHGRGISTALAKLLQERL
jgi:hypothetical protein